MHEQLDDAEGEQQRAGRHEPPISQTDRCPQQHHRLQRPEHGDPVVGQDDRDRQNQEQDRFGDQHHERLGRRSPPPIEDCCKYEEIHGVREGDDARYSPAMRPDVPGRWVKRRHALLEVLGPVLTATLTQTHNDSGIRRLGRVLLEHRKEELRCRLDSAVVEPFVWLQLTILGLSRTIPVGVGGSFGKHCGREGFGRLRDDRARGGWGYVSSQPGILTCCFLRRSRGYGCGVRRWTHVACQRDLQQR